MINEWQWLDFLVVNMMLLMWAGLKCHIFMETWSDPAMNIPTVTVKEVLQ